MLQRFRTFFSVRLEHSYFANNQFNQFLIIPEKDTADKMQQLEILYRVRNNEIYFLISEDSYDNAIRGGEGYLNFYLYLKDSHFYTYTAGNWENIHLSYLFFSNSQNFTDGDSNNNKLHMNEFANETDLKTWESNNRQGRKPFAVISIYLSQQLQPLYRIAFNAATVFWAYILVSKHLIELEEPYVETKKNDTSFERAKSIRLPGNEEAILIKSLQTIPLQENYDFKFTLCYRDNNIPKTILPVLPYPDINKVSNVIKVLEKETYKNTMEIYL